VLGVTAMGEIVRRTPLTTVAIGGIDAGNLPQVLAQGACNFAVVRAVNAAPDPVAAIRQLQAIWREAAESGRLKPGTRGRKPSRRQPPGRTAASRRRPGRAPALVRRGEQRRGKSGKPFTRVGAPFTHSRAESPAVGGRFRVCAFPAWQARPV
jgi:hypothetical protein